MEPTNPGHKQDVAKLEAEFNEREGDMFRCFAIVICLIDVEKKVEQATKGIWCCKCTIIPANYLW